MSKSNDFEVLKFTEDNLSFALSNEYLKPEEVPKVKSNHYSYLLSYLGANGLAAATIVIEFPYVSKSYLNDYASYYSLCFEPYKKHTKRIHFFQSEFSKRTFTAAILNPSGSAFKKIFGDLKYLGNLVAKPLPEAIIGPTLLRPFHNIKGRYYTTKPYKINLFGKKIKFDSLVFQEQDTVVSACATMATWVVLHKASRLFETVSPTPNQITDSAGNLFYTTGRSFPNHGLDYYQIGNVLKSVGLVAELRNNSSGPFESMFSFRAFIYAYNKIGIPVLMGIRQPAGLHLVALTGFQVDANATFLPRNATSLLAHRVEKIYVHDDQIGPYTRTIIKPTDTKGDEFRLVTDLPDLEDNGYSYSIESELVSVHAILHPKIRIQFEEVLKEVEKLDVILKNITEDSDNYEWDVYLEFSNVYKEEIASMKNLENKFKKKMLLGSSPKHIWVARLRYHGQIVYDLIFDSTAIARSFFCIAINFHNSMIVQQYKELFDNPVFDGVVSSKLGPEYSSFFKKEINRY